jgi:hypothetical protein
MTSSASPPLIADTNHKKAFLLPNTRRKAEQLFDLFSRSEDGQRALQSEVLNSSPMLGDEVADALLFLSKVTLGGSSSCHVVVAFSPDSQQQELLSKASSQQVPPPKSPTAQRRRRHSSGTGKKNTSSGSDVPSTQ